eukprot:5051518-Pleurochrysis_carterae.AAC.1
MLPCVVGPYEFKASPWPAARALVLTRLTVQMVLCILTRVHACVRASTCACAYPRGALCSVATCGGWGGAER